MTREEAKYMLLDTIDVKEYEEDERYVVVDKNNIKQIIDSIFDDFESRICKNCRYNNECAIQYAVSKTHVVKDKAYSVFGCNYFKRKDVF